MSLFRSDDPHAQRRHELRRTLRSSHRKSAVTLKAITSIIAKNASLKDLIATTLDAENSPPSDSEEVSWLKSIDLDDGHTFDEASIPPPPSTPTDNSTTRAKHNRPSPQPPQTSKTPNSSHVPARDTIATSPSGAPASDDDATIKVAQKGSRDASDEVDDGLTTASHAQSASREADGPVTLPSRRKSPQTEADPSLDDVTPVPNDAGRLTKTVRLPDDALGVDDSDARRTLDDSEPTKASRAHLQAQGEGASSPSSTVGPYSAATPLPPQDSPDTSPDSEKGDHQIELLPPPKELRPTLEEQRRKEEHDRLLEVQKDIARRQALGDISETPDEQLKWEEREAAARDAEEKAAREDVGGPEPNAKRESDRTEAAEVVDEVMQDREAERDQGRRLDDPTDNKTHTTPPIKDGRVQTIPAEDDGDNITVTPRNRAGLTIDTNRRQQASTNAADQQTPGDLERMTNRTASGVLHNRSISDILGQTPTTADPSRRSVLSPDLVSPDTLRHPQDTPVPRPSSTLETPRRQHNNLDLLRSPQNSYPALEDLDALKGAAEDLDRDYLEPLFRIQAHDPPNPRTTSLAELVRSASKTLSTEDQFMSLQERLDYKLLRRIYHLQNANKWSLRQMEKCKEPEQPVTHHDHMMAEMTWMRKDFKAERKMKISVCAWLAQRCAEWVAASGEERLKMQIKTRPPQPRKGTPEEQAQETEEQPPELEHSGESANEDEANPPTPKLLSVRPITLIVPPELSDAVTGLQKSGKLRKALETLPVTGIGFSDAVKPPSGRRLVPVSKFARGRVIPQAHGTSRKRSRYDYDDDMVEIDAKRLCHDSDLPPENQECALFHPDNKHIRDRLYANTAFRPPSEFVMPSIHFYEYRSGSQWIWEDDQKLRRLTKEYSFNWSLIADEMQLPTSVKSSAERRTPWECFERWVELEQLPTEMKKTAYFKAWFQRLEQSQQAAERRYQAHVAAVQAQNNGQATHIPPRKRSAPNRVEKRKNTRYLWLVDAMRKGARKKEQAAYKAAETQRAAAQRKNQNEGTQPRAPMLTPQEFSKKRQERDLQELELKRQNQLRQIELQKQMMQKNRLLLQAQSQAANGTGPGQQQRPGSSSNAPIQQAQMQNGALGQQQQVNMNGQQARGQGPMAVQRNGHLAVPQMNGQGIPQQAQMRPGGNMPSAQDMQRMAHANAQARSGQYGAQQPYSMGNGNMQSPGGSAMTPQQQLQSNQAMLASLQQQQLQMAGTSQPQGPNSSHGNATSPSMPPPPAPHQQTTPQSLSSGHIPALLGIKAHIKASYPNYTDEQITNMATEMLKTKSLSTNQARQNAMNAAAGINGGVAPQNNMQAFAHNQASYQNGQLPTNGGYANGDMNAQAAALNGLASSSSPLAAQQYAQLMRQRTAHQMRLQQGSPGGSSPSLAHASPNMTPVSPNLQFANPGMAGQMPSMNMQGMPSTSGRPPSRGATPQMQRLGSSGSGVQSPGQVGGVPQGSPRGMPAGVAR